MAKNTSIEKISNAWIKYQNPLRTLSTSQIEAMLENAKHGDDCRLQLAFWEIERNMPIYQVCISKRLAGVTNRTWDIVERDDSPEAKTQAKAVKEMLMKCDEQNEDGLTDAIRHLAMATFRGRSAVKPFFTKDGLILKKLNNWNLVQYKDKLYWNASADMTGWLDDENATHKLVEIPKSEICYLLEERPIDIPGLTIFLRQLVGEEQWSRFIEKQGIPQVIIKAPDGTPDAALAKWSNRAIQIFEGGSGVLPSGADVDVLDSSRGQDPFSNFIQHQMEQISILATGGTLATLGGSTGLGSNLAEVQNSQFQSLVNLDCKRISNALTSSVVRKCVKHIFGDGVECKVRFTYVEKDDTSPSEYLDLAAKLKDLGVKIDVTELKRLTNLPFIDNNDNEWTPESSSKEWTDEEKAELKAQLDGNLDDQT